MDEIAEFPAWALQLSVRWWGSRQNPIRRQQPQPGDIALRCTEELRPVYGLRHRLMIANRETDQFGPCGDPITPERAQALLDEWKHARKD